MTLFIALILIYGLDLPHQWFWYLTAFAVCIGELNQRQRELADIEKQIMQSGDRVVDQLRPATDPDAPPSVPL